jgi:hypothetical protein
MWTIAQAQPARLPESEAGPVSFGASTPNRYNSFDQGLSGCPISLDGSAPGLGMYLSIQGPPNWAT